MEGEHFYAYDFRISGANLVNFAGGFHGRSEISLLILKMR